MIKTEIITVGTELLMGYVTDTNSVDISQALLGIGVGTYYQQTVGDNPNRIKEAIKIASSRSNLIILTGGIGPTRDDITKFVLADYLGVDLVQNSTQAKRIEDYLQARGRTTTELEARQSLTFAGGTTFINKVGLACASVYVDQVDSKTPIYYVVLPGAPSEMRYLLDNELIPYIKNVIQEEGVITSLYLNFTDIGEAPLATLIDEEIESQTNPTIAIYARPRLVTVRLTANAESTEEAEELNQSLADKLLEKLDQYFVGYGKDYSLADFIVHELEAQNKTLAVAESLTGGLVQGALTSAPGASSVIAGGLVTYQNEVKIRELGVNAQDIKNYTAVSSPVAKQMAEGLIERFKTDYALSFTGVAGPDPVGSNPVGTYYIALARLGQETIVEKTEVGTHRTREQVRQMAKDDGLGLLRKELLGLL